MKGTRWKYNRNARLHWWKIDLVCPLRIKGIPRKTIWVWARSQGKANRLAEPYLPKPGYDYNGTYICRSTGGAYNCTEVPHRRVWTKLIGVGKPRWFDFKIKDG